MFDTLRDTEYYKNLAKELDNKIKTYEKAYDVVYGIAVVHRDEFTDSELAEATNSYINFCGRERIGYKFGKNVHQKELEASKIQLDKQIDILRKQKENCELIVNWKEEKDALKNNSVPERVREHLKEDAIKSLDGGRPYTTEELDREYRKLEKNYIKKRKEQLPIMKKEYKNAVKSLRKSNGIKSIYTSSVSSIKRPFYNAYAGVHNFNNELRKMPAFNFPIKLALCIVSGAGALMLAPSVPIVLSLVELGIVAKCIVSTFKHLFTDRKNPPKDMEYIGKSSVRDSLSRAIKSRKVNGKVNSNIYSKSLIDKLVGLGKKTPSPVIEEEKEKNISKEEPEVKVEEEKVDEIGSETPSPVPAEDTVDDKESTLPKEEEKAPVIEEPTPVENTVDSKDEEIKNPEPEREEPSIEEENTNDDAFKQEGDFNIEMHDFADVCRFLGALEARRSSVKDKRRYHLNLKEYYAIRYLDENLSKIVQDSLDKIKNDDRLTFKQKKESIEKMRETVKHIDEKIIKPSLENFSDKDIARLTKESRTNVYEEAFEFIANNDFEESNKYIDNLKRHYKFSQEQLNELNNALLEKKVGRSR